MNLKKKKKKKKKKIRPPTPTPEKQSRTTKQFFFFCLIQRIIPITIRWFKKIRYGIMAKTGKYHGLILTLVSTIW